MTELFVTTMTRQDIEALVIDCMKAVVKHHLPKPEQVGPPGQANEPFLTKKQAAKKLNCSTSTIDNYARAGKLTREYVGGVGKKRKSVRFRLEEVLALAKPTSN